MANDQEAVKQNQENVNPEATASATEQGKKTEEKSEYQKRIDQLIARAKTAEEKLQLSEAEKQAIIERGVAKEPEYGITDTEYPLDQDTEKMVRKIVKEEVGQKEFVSNFEKAEKKVFDKHPDMLNQDGSYNHESEKVKKYVEIGKKYPQLRNMADGPIIAMRMMESEKEEARIIAEKAKAFEEGQKTETQRQQTTDKAFTGASTTQKPTEKKVQLTEGQKNIARKMGMTDEQYVANLEKRPIIGKPGAKL